MQRRTLVVWPVAGAVSSIVGCSPKEDLREVQSVPVKAALLSSRDFPLVLKGTGPDYKNFDSVMVDERETGVSLVSTSGYHLSSLNFRNIAGAAVNLQTSGGGYEHVGYLSQISASHSYYGFKFWKRAEYETVSDCSASSCAVGFFVGSGNNSFSNCKATNCSTGVRVTGGSNSAHGVWSGLMSNHCTYNLVCEDVSLGEHFNGCCFIGGQLHGVPGKIRVVNSQGIAVTGSQLSDVDLFVDERSQVLLNAVTFGGSVNIRVAPGGVLVANNNLVMPGAALSLNGVPWLGFL